jgi:hypothetical protein
MKAAPTLIIWKKALEYQGDNPGFTNDSVTD